MKLSVLQDLRHAGDSPLKDQSAPAHPPFWGAEGQYLGHEWARWRYDTLDDRVDRWLETSAKPGAAILDLGCATGVRAADFAVAGYRVTAVDVLDRTSEIGSRNETLRQTTPGAHPIVFVQADLRQPSAWSSGTSFGLVHIRRVITFVEPDALDRVFSMAAGVLSDDGILVVSFIAVRLDEPQDLDGVKRPALSLGSGVHAHDVGAIRKLMRAQGLVSVEMFSDGRVEAGLIARKNGDAASHAVALSDMR